MKKQKFSVMCPVTFFDESVPVPPEPEKYCADVSLPGCIGMHYMTYRTHQMEKQKSA
jgi:hypothetical protein